MRLQHGRAITYRRHNLVQSLAQVNELRFAPALKSIVSEDPLYFHFRLTFSLAATGVCGKILLVLLLV